MSKQYFIELAGYNIWANNIVIGWLESINDEQWNQVIISSFNSVQETVLHIISAEYAWGQRLMKQEFTWLQSSFKGTKQEHSDLWKFSSQQLKDFIEQFDEAELTTNLDFKRLNGQSYSMPYYQILAHTFNHSTYHRGQLVTMLRQANFTNTSSTDLIGFYR